MSVKVRFAPSPTGRLHVGNVRTALVNWLFARNQGGKFVLRIDDTDLERSTKEYEAAIQQDLTWLGLGWDEMHHQSARFPVYQAAAERLKDMGKLYPAYETQEELDRRRKVQLSRGLPPIYDRAALKLTRAEIEKLEAEGRRPHWRFRLDGRRVKWNDLVRGESEVDTSSMSDPVLIREDGAFLYTLPSVVDDIDMEISHVIRGEDHVTNTGTQIEIFQALGAKEPGFAHMALLVDADGGPLSKRLGSLSVGQMRDQGFEPLAIASHLARIGTSDGLEAGASLTALGSTFSFDKMGRHPARYDTADLERLNAQVLHAMDYAQAKPRLAALDADLGEGFWTLVRANLGKLDDVRLWAEVVRGPIAPYAEDAPLLAAAAELLPVSYGEGSWSSWTDAVKAKTGAKGKALFMPLRKAITGQDHGPDMAALTVLIGRDKIERRLKGEAA
jgi:glutamyl-tRNA synthetase